MELSELKERLEAAFPALVDVFVSVEWKAKRNAKAKPVIARVTARCDKSVARPKLEGEIHAFFETKCPRGLCYQVKLTELEAG